MPWLTPDDDPTPVTHIDVFRPALRPDCWVARCLCGWASEKLPREVEAWMAGDDHLLLIHGGG